jgi:hypothetical protein
MRLGDKGPEAISGVQLSHLGAACQGSLPKLLDDVEANCSHGLCNCNITGTKVANWWLVDVNCTFFTAAESWAPVSKPMSRSPKGW